PIRAAELIARYVPKDGAICDAGVGTGLLGELLRKQGFSNLIGLDLSQAMLDQAEAKGIYQALHLADLSGPLDLPSSTFDCTACVGTLTPGHAPVSAVDEFVRITKPGGHVIFTMPNVMHDTPEVIDHLAGLERSGRCELLDDTTEFSVLPDSEPEVLVRGYVYGVGED